MKKKLFTVDKFGKVSVFGLVGFIGFASDKRYINRGFNAGSRVLKIYKGMAGMTNSKCLCILLNDNLNDFDIDTIFHAIKLHCYTSTVDVKLYAPFRNNGRKLLDTLTIF